MDANFNINLLYNAIVHLFDYPLMQLFPLVGLIALTLMGHRVSGSGTANSMIFYFFVCFKASYFLNVYLNVLKISHK